MHMTINKLLSHKRNQFQLQVQDISIEESDVIALIGANGSGKTTLMESILGLTKTAKRDMTILGLTASEFDKNEQIRQKVGIQLQKSAFQSGMKVNEIIKMHQLMYSIQSSEIYKLLEIDKIKSTNYCKLSRGQRQRVDLYIALAHNPELVFLDEPSTGLDSLFKRCFSKILNILRKSGSSILMGSHTLEEIEFCNKVLWLEKGHVKHFGSCQDVVSKALGQFRIDLSFSSPDFCHHTEALLRDNYLEKIVRYHKQGNSLTLFCNTNIFIELITKIGADHLSSSACRTCSHIDLIEQGSKPTNA